MLLCYRECCCIDFVKNCGMKGRRVYCCCCEVLVPELRLFKGLWTYTIWALVYKHVETSQLFNSSRTQLKMCHSQIVAACCNAVAQTRKPFWRSRAVIQSLHQQQKKGACLQVRKMHPQMRHRPCRHVQHHLYHRTRVLDL